MTNLNEKTKRIGTEVSTKNFEKSLKKVLTDYLKNGKIIKLSEITESNTKLNNALKKILKSEKSA